MGEKLDKYAKQKEYLNQYQQAVRQMERSELRIKEIRLNKICPTVKLDGMPRASGHSDLSSYAALLDEAEQEYIRYRYYRVKLCKEITDKIELSDSEDEKDVLTYRYIKLMKWEDICEAMHVSWRQVHNIHNKALEHFETCA